MSVTAGGGDILAAYLAALREVDYDGAIQVLDDALQQGMSWSRLVAEVVAPAQEQIGRLWMSGTLGVADEHAATTVAENVLAVLSPPVAPPVADVRVIMVCAAGEWHTFPLRLAATVAARSEQLRLTVLGGSVSGDHLRMFLRNAEVDAVALSTTMTAHLIGAAENIRAATEEGVPVVVGGAAWGTGQSRARRLGAALHLRDPSQLAAAVASLDGPRPVADLPDLPQEALLLDSPPEELLRLALKRQAATTPWMRGLTEAQERHTLNDFAWMARHAANAVACDDATIVGDLLVWLLEVLTPRGVPSDLVLDSALHLADAVEPVAPMAAGLLRQQAGDIRVRVDQREDDAHG